MLDSCLHLFLHSKLKEVKEHPYHATLFPSNTGTKIVYTRLCILGLIVYNIRHDLLDKLKYCLQQVPFMACFPTSSSRFQLMKKCIAYKKIEVAETILKLSSYTITLEECLELGSEGYLLYSVGELKKLRNEEESEVNYAPTSENDFEIDTVCFSIFREIEDNLNRQFLQDAMGNNMDLKTYLSYILKTRGLTALHPYIINPLSESLQEYIRSYAGQQELETIIEE